MILVLGSGLLATEVIAQTGWTSISRSKDGFDLTNQNSWKNKIPKNTSTIVNCIANTDTYSEDPDSMLETNYHSIIYLVNYCNKNKIKLVHYSTDYVYANSKKPASETDIEIPANNWYSKSKLLADKFIISNCDNYLICRGSHKINPFPWQKAWTNQFGNFDYVDKIVELFVSLIQKNATGLYNIGTDIKNIYQMAIETNPSVEGVMAPYHIPKNLSMDLTKMKNFLNNYIEDETK